MSVSFDDGPTPSTPQLLTALAGAHMYATFFDIGVHAQQYPDYVRAEHAAGDAVGNHSYTHPDLVQLGEPFALTQLQQTQAVLTPLIGSAPTLFRPPYGSENAQVKADATGLGMTMVIWTADTQDWSGVSTSAIVSSALAVQPGGFILMHDGYPNTIAAIPKIAAGLASRGLCPGKIIYSAVPTLAWEGGAWFNATVASPTSTAPSGPPPPGTGPTGLSALVDNFDGPVFNNTVWDGSSYGVVGQTGGRGFVPCTAAYPQIGTSTTYDLTNAGALVQVTVPPVGNGSREVMLNLAADPNDQLEWLRSGSTFVPRYVAGGLWTSGPPVGLAPWWRIADANGSVLWETSADGLTWRTQWVVHEPFAVKAMTAAMICGAWGTETASDAFFDNVNLAPAGTQTVLPTTTTTSTTAPSTTTSTTIPPTTSTTIPPPTTSTTIPPPTTSTTIPPTGPPSIATLTDSFGASTFNGSLWNGSSTGVVTEAGGHASIPCTSSYPTIGTTTTYGLAGAAAFVRFTLPAAGNGTREAFFQLQVDDANRLQWMWSGGVFAPRYEVAGVWTQGPSAAITPWWRIGESAGTVVWSTSPDGVTWTTRWTAADPFAVTALSANMVCGAWGTETAASATVADFNVHP